MRARILFVGLSTMVLLGCPAEVKDTKPAPEKPQAPQVDESDPRVVKVGDDLYAADAVPDQQPPGKEKGSGKPDESNGYCRLYAPKLPDPTCCLTEFGFDAASTGQACGKPLYLGESFLRSCGHYFHDPQSGDPVWFRTSFVEAESPKAAAEAEAARLNTRFNAGVEVKPMKDNPQAFRVEYSGIAYAYMSGDPGWRNVRRLAWRTTSCTDEGIESVVSQMSTAKPPPKGAKRESLIPKAR